MMRGVPCLVAIITLGNTRLHQVIDDMSHGMGCRILMRKLSQRLASTIEGGEIRIGRDSAEKLGDSLSLQRGDVNLAILPVQNQVDSIPGNKLVLMSQLTTEVTVFRPLREPSETTIRSSTEATTCRLVCSKPASPSMKTVS